jgi:hypothetical protein
MENVQKRSNSKTNCIHLPTEVFTSVYVGFAEDAENMRTGGRQSVYRVASPTAAAGEHYACHGHGCGACEHSDAQHYCGFHFSSL